MKKVQILLSTYNGEKFLREQIESLRNQKGVIVRISVRDDGSTDSTLDILEEYKKLGILEYYSEKNIGYEKSFITLASYCVGQADYYAFCDQDDVWDTQKLMVAINKLEEINIQKPKLYFSNLKIVDKDLKKIGVKDYSKLNIALGTAMVRHNISGCTMVFNNELLQLAIINNFLEIPVAHDEWFYKICLSIDGIIIFDSNSYINYRQHGNNVTGVRQGIKKRLSRELRGFTNKKNYRLKTAQIIHREYSTLISKDNLELLTEIIMYRNSFKNTIKLLLKKELKFGILVVDALTKVEIIFRCY